MTDSIPPVTVEVAFDGGPFSTSYTWRDVTSWVEGFSVKRGRNTETDRFEAGTLDLTLDNSDGRFTPQKNWSTELLPANVTTGTETLSNTTGFNSGSGVTITSSTDATHSGTRTLKIQGPSTTGSWQSLVSTDQIPVKAGNKYRSAVWMRNTVNVGFPAMNLILRMFFYDVNHNFIDNTMVDSPTITLAAGDNTYILFEATGFAPPGAAYAQLHVQDPTAPGIAWLIYGDDWSLTEVAPYYPNVIPRRRVRIRTANLLPKDTATGGDISQGVSNFSTAHISGMLAPSWNTAVEKSGAGCVRVDFKQIGASQPDFSTSIFCGYMKTITWQGWGAAAGWTSTRIIPTGMAKVNAGTYYVVSGWYRMGVSSTGDAVKARMRWYKEDGTFFDNSMSTTIAAVSGQYVQFYVSGQAPTDAVWANIEIGTNGANSGGYGFIDELQIEEGFTPSAWTPGGSIFSGFVEKWPVKISGLTSEVAVSAVDGLNLLGTTEFQRPLRQHMLSLAPWGYWPLTDGDGTARVENLANDQLPAALAASKYGGATAAFGAPSVVKNDDGTSYSLTNISDTQGTVIDVLDGGSRAFPTLADEFSVSFWCLPTRPSSGSVVLFRSTDAQGFRAVELRLDSTGTLALYIGYANGGSAMTVNVASLAPLSQTVPSMLTAYISAGVGNLYINDIYQGDTSASGVPSDHQLRQPKYMTLAGNQGSAYWMEYASGTYGHFAVWDRSVGSDLKFTEAFFIGDHYGVFSTFQEPETARLTRLVTYAGFLGETVFDSTVSTLQGPTWDEGTNALEELQHAAEDASGYVFMDGDGKLVYHNRARRQGGPVRFVLGDSTGLPYESDLDLDVDEDRIVNEVAFKRPNGASSVIRDQASIDAHGRKTKSLELRVVNDSEVVNASYSTLNQYKDPIMRCDSVTLKASATPALFPVVLGIEVGDKITIGDLPAASPSSSMSFYVEAIESSVTAQGVTPEWITVLSLSPATASDVWVLEDDVLGLLDQTTELAW